jgi:hypothetical protein
LVCKFIPDPPDFEDEESDEEEGSKTKGSQSGDSEEVVDEDIVADEPPTKALKLADPISEDPASKRSAPKSSSSGKP